MSGRIILYQLDGSLPNLALMRLVSHFRKLRRRVVLRDASQVGRKKGDTGNETVYASLIFKKTKHIADGLLHYWPNAIIGGTGWDLKTTLESIGIDTATPDYGLYPDFRSSIGFTQRGCRLRCPFCVVPKKEGAVRQVNTIHDIWRGDGYPKDIVLLDNDFFGQEDWRKRIDEIRDGNFRVNFSQGINIRTINDEEAKAIASVNYRNTRMDRRSVFTAWDNTKDEKRVFNGLQLLVDAGIKPRHIMVYMLVGYWPKETIENNLYRVKKLREFGAMPYPMPFVRNSELVGLQRWCVGAYDKRIPWKEWEAANYQPRNLTR